MRPGAPKPKARIAFSRYYFCRTDTKILHVPRPIRMPISLVEEQTDRRPLRCVLGYA